MARAEHEADKQRWHSAHENLRRNANSLLAERDRQIQELQSRISALESQAQRPPMPSQPAAQPQPWGNGSGSGSGNGSGSNYGASDWTAEEQEVIQRMRDEHGEGFINDFFALADKRVQRSLMHQFDGLNQRFDSRFAGIEQTLGNVQQNYLRDEAAMFDQQMRDFGHPDWEAVRASPEFHDWLMGHVFGAEYRAKALPQQMGEGGTSAQVARILDEYRADNPALQAARQRHDEAANRAAAAAASNRGAPLVGAEIPAATPAEYLTVSNLGNELRAKGNNPQAIRELRRKMESTIQQGRLVDDMSGRAPVPFQGGVVP